MLRKLVFVEQGITTLKQGITTLTAKLKTAEKPLNNDEITEELDRLANSNLNRQANFGKRE